MTLLDAIGFFGVFMLLMAYFFNVKGILGVDNITYILLNLIGATIACLVSFKMEYYPFVLLEGTWTIISINALIKYYKNNGKTLL